jgi:hypothetical protein
MEAAATAVPAPAGAAARLRRRPRVPTSIVVAVLGVALGSWLIPAFTRQWDDRQKAGELKALVVADIASATGRALMDAQAASAAAGGDRSSQATIRDWSLASLQIRAKLQAYFGPTAVDRWALVSQYVTSTLSVAYGRRDGSHIVPATIPSLTVSQVRSPQLERLFRQYLTGDEVIESLELGIFAEQERVTTSILAMHVRGYSTTWQDVVDDLFP